MTEFIRTKERLKINSLAWYQIAGAIISIIMMIWFIAGLPVINGPVFLLIALVLLLVAFSIFCGYQLLKGNAMKGLKYSMISQVLQIFSFAISGWSYKYASGLAADIIIDFTDNVDFTFNLSSSNFQLSINGQEQFFVFGINFVAIGMVWFIEKLKKDIEAEKELSALAAAAAVEVRSGNISPN